MANIFRGILVATLLLLATHGGIAYGADNSWLVGTWELTYDPDGSEKDWVEFTADGKSYSISPKGRRLPGEYSLSGQTISNVFTYNGKTIPQEFTVSSDKKKLLFYSKKTGSTSEYEKLQQ